MPSRPALGRSHPITEGCLLLAVHNHSEFSALDGFATAKEIADRIEAIGLSGAFLTDHGTTAGWTPFAKEMQSRGLQWGLGMEAYMARESRLLHPKRIKGEKGDAFHLILLAKNTEGYRNLLRLSDEANRSGYYYYPRVDWDLLERYREGLICTSACMGGLVCDGIERSDLSDFHRYREIFGDDFYIELHTYQSEKQRDLNLALQDLADDFSCPVVVANDAHYPSPDNHYHHELLLAMQMNRQVDMDDPYHPPCLYIMDDADVRKALLGHGLRESMVRDAIDNTELIYEKCKVALPEHKTYLPSYPADEAGKTSAEQMLDLLFDGLEKRYGVPLSEAVIDRAIFEYQAIAEAGLSDYFMIVHDFLTYAYKKGILVGPGRGSAGGSILAYALGITHIDPLKYGLYFERFWNPGRSAGLPDIDIDFEVIRRKEVKEYVTRKWGEDRVLGIGNHIRMGAKSAIDKVAKATWADQVEYRDMKAIKAIIDSTTDAGLAADWEAIIDLVGDELDPWIDQYPGLFRDADEMTGRIATYGVHASAVVISSVPLPEHLPAMLRTSKDDDGATGEKVLVTQLDMRGVEDAGFPKFDFLGLRNLDTLMATALASGDFDHIEDEVERRQAIIDHYRDYPYFSLPDSYWEQLEKGHTLGFFQIEEGASAKRIAKRVKPRSIGELGLAVGMNRPGPLRGGSVDRMIARRDGEEEVVYPHEILRDVLEETQGEFIYQEQVISFMRAIGYSLGEADHIRKVMGKKKVEAMLAEKPTYLERATKYMPEATAESLWQLVWNFSKYGFNKSHAVGYGMILAWTMYAKWKWPVEFIMSSIITNPKKAGEYIKEGFRLGVKVGGPDINRSAATISKVGTEILFGLVDIKGVGYDAVRWIEEHRPYASYEDFMLKLGDAQAVWEEDKRGKSPRQRVRSNVIQALLDAGAFDAIHDRGLTESEMLDLEEELLGVALWTDERLARLIGEHRERLESMDGLEVLDTDDQEEYWVPGIITSVTTTRTRDTARYQPGRSMGFVTIEWKGQAVRCAAFPDAWDAYRFMFKRGVVGEFHVRTGKRGASLMKGKIIGQPD